MITIDKTKQNMSEGLSEDKKDFDNFEIRLAIDDLCLALLKNPQSFSPDDWVCKLDKYIEKHDRLMYTHISFNIFNYNSEQISVMFSNLEKSREICQSKETSKIILKFLDHANLANIQLSMVKKSKQEIDQEIKCNLNEAMTTSTRNLTSQLIGLVAIFTALSFLVFGGIDSLEGILTVLSKGDNIFKVIIVGLVWSLCISNLLLLFIHFIFKITNSQSHFNELEKSPAIKTVNLILIIALVWSSWLYALSKNGTVDKVLMFLKNSNLSMICITVIILIVSVILVYRYIKGNKRICRCLDKNKIE